MTVAMHLDIAGKVQGVGFRFFVTRSAQHQGLRGWVRNRLDGNVEALLIGEEAAVAAVTEQCRRGPPMGRVDHLDAVPAQDDGSTDFIERATV
ncbi:MAG TPA: acylphosphatase [Stellaceae bacterium]|jgi:acylphosphatase|nr:acylphosphatase [Stellaceae bacterium]